MDSKDLMSLISEDVKELSLLCGGMSEMSVVPSSVLVLAKGKANSLLQRIEQLESYQNTEAKRKESDPVAIKVVEPVIEEVVVEKTAPAPKDEKPTQPETPKSEAPAAKVEEEPVKVVDKVAYQSAKEPELETGESPTKENNDVPNEKHGEVVHDEIKPHVHEFAGVRTVLDANRSSKRVESRFVQSIRKAITLNDRIRYLNELFGGDAELMSSTIATLDSMKSFKEAADYVKWNFSWDEEDEAVGDFMRLLEDRFS